VGARAGSARAAATGHPRRPPDPGGPEAARARGVPDAPRRREGDHAAGGGADQQNRTGQSRQRARASEGERRLPAVAVGTTQLFTPTGGQLEDPREAFDRTGRGRVRRPRDERHAEDAQLALGLSLKTWAGALDLPKMAKHGPRASGGSWLATPATFYRRSSTRVSGGCAAVTTGANNSPHPCISIELMVLLT